MGRLVQWPGVAAVLLAMMACGDDPQSSPSNPHQDCRDFIDAWCNKNAECVLPSERARTLEDCHFVVELDVDCNRVVEVSASYGACMNAIVQTSCGSNGSVALPTTCRGVLLK
jgi:hypothetical protein